MAPFTQLHGNLDFNQLQESNSAVARSARLERQLALVSAFHQAALRVRVGARVPIESLLRSAAPARPTKQAFRLHTVRLIASICIYSSCALPGLTMRGLGCRIRSGTEL
jgi:hypothetical protein